jgi:hypothetical protein
MAQAMRAILLASAMAATLVERRAISATSQGHRVEPVSLARRITESAPTTRSFRK